MAGHSHGGAIVEELVRGDLRPNYAGVILFGSYITNNNANGETNDYPIPLLAAVGTLDGRATSYAVREWRESKVSPASDDLPVILVEDCTHLQVSSGGMQSYKMGCRRGCNQPVICVLTTYSALSHCQDWMENSRNIQHHLLLSIQ